MASTGWPAKASHRAIRNIQRQAAKGQIGGFGFRERLHRAGLPTRRAQRSSSLGQMIRGKRAARGDQGQNLFHIRPMPVP